LTDSNPVRNFNIGDFLVEPSLNRLTINGKQKLLEPKVMQVLQYLAMHPNQVVSRQELIDSLWKSQVSDGAVSRIIALLRKALEDNSDEPRYIQTVAKRGYRLIADVSVESPSQEQAHPSIHNIYQRNWLLSILIVSALFLVNFVVIFNYFSPITSEYNNFKKPQFQQLTSDPGFEYDPHLSHDGKWLVYRHRKSATEPFNLYLKNLNTQVITQLTDTLQMDRAPTFSHDQTRIAYFSKADNFCQINVMSISKSGAPEKIVSVYQCGAYDHYSNLVWSNDDTTLYFTDRKSAQVPYQIFKIFLPTLKVIEVTPQLDNYYGDNELALSPSGKFLAFFRNKYWGNNQVYVLDLESGSSKKLLELGFLAWNISWTPDERHLLFSDNRLGGSIRAIDVNTAETSLWYTSPQKIHSPELSDDGRSIIFSTETAQVNLWEGKISDARLSQPQKLPFNSSRSDRQPKLSPDGKKLVFISDRNGYEQLWMKQEEGLSAFASIPQSKTFEYYSWHPNSQTLVLTTADKTTYLLNTDTDMLTPVNIDTVAYPSFNYNGDALVYGSDMSGDWQIWTYSLATQHKTQITTLGGYHAQTINGMDYYFTKYRQPGIWKIDASTQQEQLLIKDVERWVQFKICSDSIIYLVRHDEYRLAQFRQTDKQTNILGTFSPDSRIQLDINEDCQQIFYSTWQNIESDILMLTR